MSIETPLTGLLGIRHPILQAPMDTIAGARLVAAVSNAGGFGILGGGYGNPAWLEAETAKLKQCSAPFGIGFITWSLARRPELLDIALKARPRAIMLSFGDPKPFAPRIKSAGALLICQVQSEDMALQGARRRRRHSHCAGYRGGWARCEPHHHRHRAGDRRSAAGRVPVVAAGGIADGRGLAAMMMLGACGVLLGTRFYASVEADGAEEAKERIVAATSGSTVRGVIFDLSRSIIWPAPFTGRTLINDHARRWTGREVELLQSMDAVASEYAAARAARNFDVAAVFAGEAVGLIHDIPPAAEIIDRIVAEADQIMSGRRNSSTARKA